MNEKVDNYVEEWHNGPSKCSLSEYLGLSDKEYSEWVRNCNMHVEKIIKFRDKMVMSKRLLTEEEKKADPRFPAVVKVFPEFYCYDDGTYEVNKDKIPPGVAYIMNHKDASKEVKNASLS